MARNREIWIFGGAGYIGSHIAQALVDAKEPVSILDRNSLSERQRMYGLGDVKSVTAEIEDQILRRHIAVDPISQLVIIHSAGPSSVAESYQDPLRYFRDHLGSTIELVNFLSWLSRSKPNISTSVIYASSCTVYDQNKATPFTEDSPLEATSPYAQSKLASENLLKHFANSTKTPVICFRFFNAAGADPRGHLSEFHNPETHLIPLLLQSAKSLKKTFDVYGNKYPTKDGTCVRDFVHVNDIAQAHVCAITKHEAPRAPSTNRHLGQPLFNRYNLGSGTGTSVLAALRASEQATGHKFEIKYRKNRPGDAPMALANIAKAQEELDWQPQKSNLQQIINDASSSMESALTQVRVRNPSGTT